MKILVLDACVRGSESRSKVLLDCAVKTLEQVHPEAEFEKLNLMELNLSYFDKENLDARDLLIKQGHLDHPRFCYAHQFAQADAVVVAAPFWDLSIPAVLKVYIENISLDGITFKCSKEGVSGTCKAQWMLFLTTRGGCCQGTEMELGSRYMEALCRQFGIDTYIDIFAEGLDEEGADQEAIMQAALYETEHVCKGL